MTVPFDEIAPIVDRSPAAARQLASRARRRVHGAAPAADAEQVRSLARLARFARPALVNGAAGFVVAQRGRPLAVAGFTVAHGRIVEIDLLADPERLHELDLTMLDG